MRCAWVLAWVLLHMALLASAGEPRDKQPTPETRRHFGNGSGRFDLFKELREDSCQADTDCNSITGRVCERKPNDAAGRCRCPPERPVPGDQGHCAERATGAPTCRVTTECRTPYMECVAQRCQCLPPNVQHDAEVCGPPAPSPEKSSMLPSLAFFSSVVLLMVCTVFLTRNHKDDEALDGHENSKAVSPGQRGEAPSVPLPGEGEPQASSSVRLPPPASPPPTASETQGTSEGKHRHSSRSPLTVRSPSPKSDLRYEQVKCLSDDFELPSFVSSPEQCDLQRLDAVSVQRRRRGLEFLRRQSRREMLQSLLDGRDLLEREDEGVLVQQDGPLSKAVQTEITLAPAIIPFAAQLDRDCWPMKWENLFAQVGDKGTPTPSMLQGHKDSVAHSSSAVADPDDHGPEALERPKELGEHSPTRGGDRSIAP